MVYVTRMAGESKDPIVAMLACRSRGEVGRWGAFLDGEGTQFRGPLISAAKRAGADLPDDAEALSGKALLRACLSRTTAAQVRTNPIVRDESFVCAHCGAAVSEGGKRPRDHCPQCLHGRHVDVVPGDRAASCGGNLVPYGAEQSSKGWMVLYRCDLCGMVRRNRFLDDVAQPDSSALLRALVSGGPS